MILTILDEVDLLIVEQVKEELSNDPEFLKAYSVAKTAPTTA